MFWALLAHHWRAYSFMKQLLNVEPETNRSWSSITLL